MPAVQTNEIAALRLYDQLPDAIVWYAPVYTANQEITDFSIQYVNQALLKVLGLPEEELMGSALRNSRFTDEENVVPIFSQCKQVFETGESLEASYYSSLYEQYFQVTRIKVLNGVLSVVRNRTKEWQLELEKQQQASFTNQIVDASPTCIVLAQAIGQEGAVEDFLILSVNEKIVKDLQRSKTSIEGLRYTALHPGIRTNGYLDMMIGVVTSGKPFRGEMYLEIFGGWFFVSADKVGSDKVVVICLDINETKQSSEGLKKLNEELEGILNASLTGICSLKAVRDQQGTITDFVYDKVNYRFEEITGFKVADVTGQYQSSILPHIKEAGFFDWMCEVINSGQPQRLELQYNNDGLNGWFECSLSATGSDTIVVCFDEITEKKTYLLEVEQQRRLLDNILKHSPAGISVSQMLRDENGKIWDYRTVLANDMTEPFTGIPKELALSKRGSEIAPGILDTPLFAQALETIRTGNPFTTQYFLEPWQKWLELSVSKLDDDHLINVFSDITTRKEIELTLEHAAQNLKKVIDSAQTGMFTFRPEYADGQMVDFRFDIVNATVASYVNQSPENLQGQLGSTFFPSYKATGVFDMYRETYETGATLRQEIHYDVDGHDNYLDIQSTKVDEVVLVTFTDHTPMRQAQIKLERLVEDLKRSNASLEEFAYAASHDLKEPIRKIHFFSDRLRETQGHLLDENGKMLFAKMNNATDRMRTLVEDLLSYSQVSVRPKIFDEVDLNGLVQEAISDLEVEIDEKKGQIICENLPVIRGHQRQLQQLFFNLIGNALKYSREEEPPVIHIRSRIIRGYESNMKLIYDDRRKSFHLVELTDNGIGFEQKDAERIFQVFQRLHGNTEYRGTGVGLSIVKKVVEHHKGYIEAFGEPGKGATFRILLPVMTEV